MKGLLSLIPMFNHHMKLEKEIEPPIYGDQITQEEKDRRFETILDDLHKTIEKGNDFTVIIMPDGMNGSVRISGSSSVYTHERMLQSFISQHQNMIEAANALRERDTKNENH